MLKKLMAYVVEQLGRVVPCLDLVKVQFTYQDQSGKVTRKSVRLASMIKHKMAATTARPYGVFTEMWTADLDRNGNPIGPMRLVERSGTTLSLYPSTGGTYGIRVDKPIGLNLDVRSGEALVSLVNQGVR